MTSKDILKVKWRLLCLLSFKYFSQDWKLQTRRNVNELLTVKNVVTAYEAFWCFLVPLYQPAGLLLGIPERYPSYSLGRI